MILQNSVEKIISESTTENTLYLRNLIKGEIQNYILNFVFTNNDYNKLFFTGGTCLQKVYGLNRISEDLDFDYVGEFNVEDFAKNVEKYFKSVIQYDSMSCSISSNGKTVYFKFPILKELNMYSNKTPEDIFVRCDFSREENGGYVLDKNMISAGAFQFFVTSYDLSTLFANKIVAFLERSFYKGKFQETPFKGRDVYDLFWLIQVSGRSSYNLKASTSRLRALLGDKTLEQIKKMVLDKIALIDPKTLYDDLYPLLPSKNVLEGFMDSYKDYLTKYLDFVL